MNLVNNILQIEGPESDIEEFLNKNLDEDGNLTFGFLAPCPIELFGTPWPIFEKDIAEYNITTYGYDSWYEFCIHEWGTKWNVRDTCVADRDEGKVRFLFDTATSPCDPWVKKAIRKYTTLKFEYNASDPYMGWYLVITGERGDIIVENWRSADMDWLDTHGADFDFQ